MGISGIQGNRRLEYAPNANHPIGIETGQDMDEEIKKKISMAMRGENNPFYGKRHTVESKAKISQNRRGIYPSDETLAKLRIANSGESNGFYGKKHSEKTRFKLSELAKKRKATKETCLAISEGHKGVKNSFYGKHHTQISNERNRIAHIGKEASSETKKKMSAKHKKTWSQSEEYKNRRIGNIVRGNKKSPNKKELAIWDMLEEIQPNIWRFIGNGKDGETTIDAFWGKMPDFWNGDHKFVEHYGVWWHRNHNPQERIDLFAKHGCKMLIIQEMELMEHHDQVKTKIADFVIQEKT